MIYVKYIELFFFRVFLVCIFFLYYQTRFFPGSVHSYIMLAGLLLIVPSACLAVCRGCFKVSYDYVIVFVMMLLIVFGYVLNISTTSWAKFQSYVLMLLTYVYVKENTDESTIAFVLKVIKVFLVVNGVLILFQVFTAGFYPAKYLASGNPPLLIPSGLSDGPTKNGFLVAFSLSVMMAHFIFKKLSFSVFDFFVFVLGLVSLVFSASRAGLISFMAVSLVGSCFAIVQSLRNNEFRISRVFILAVSCIFVGVVYSVDRLGIHMNMLYGLRDPDIGSYGLNVIIYKLSNFMDSSVLERVSGYSFLLTLICDKPLQFFTVGIGAGSFEILNGLNVHNSWLELLVATGVNGFLLFVVLNIYQLFRALTGEMALRLTPMIFALISIMVFMMAHDVLRGRIFWIALGIIAGYNSLSRSIETYKTL